MSIFFDPDWDNKSRKRKRKRTGKFSFKLWFLKWALVCVIWLSIIIGSVIAYYSYTMPNLDKVFNQAKTPVVKVIDRNGNLIGRFGQLYGKNISYNNLPKDLIDAVTSTEDRRFFSHHGIDFIGLARASYANYKAKRIVQGGSTITQQLAKITFLTPDRTFRRKLQELFIAFYLEYKFTKRQIFSMYMNRVYLGAGNYGVDAAAKSYFGKDVKNLNLFECAMIAGLIQAPSRYSPINNPDLAAKRTNEVLMNMYENGKLVSKDIVNKQYNFNPYQIKADKGIYYPYFGQWIKDQVSEYVSPSYDKDIVVNTTFDSKLQNIAENALLERMKLDGPSHNASQAAMVVLSKDGEVLAMVGGVDHSLSQFNRVTQAMRQPGSAFKIFVYLTALEQGYSPNDHILDAPIRIGNWQPSNYNNKYMGEVTLDYAFANSINSVAVRLAQKIGMSSIIDTAHRLGISSEIKNNLSSALGASEVNLLELTGAYAHLANQGNTVWIHGINSIVTDNNKFIYKRKETVEKRVIDRNIVSNMDELLRHVVTEGTGRNAIMNRPSYGKTGTSQDYRDAWFIGFTGEYVVGVWVGNDNNSPMKNVAGGSLPTQIWKDFMVAATKGMPSKEMIPHDEFENLLDKVLGNDTSKEDNSIKYEYPSAN